MWLWIRILTGQKANVGEKCEVRIQMKDTEAVSLNCLVFFVQNTKLEANMNAVYSSATEWRRAHTYRSKSWLYEFRKDQATFNWVELGLNCSLICSLRRQSIAQSAYLCEACVYAHMWCQVQNLTQNASQKPLMATPGNLAQQVIWSLEFLIPWKLM